MLSTERIKNIRIEKNLSQIDIAKKMGISRSSYAMWESNNNIFPLKRLNDYCNIMNCSIDYALMLNDKNVKVKKDIDLDKLKVRLKEFRNDNNLTQEKICSFLHIDQPTWSIYENAKNLIGTPFLYQICKKYKISADYLLGKIDNPKYLK